MRQYYPILSIAGSDSSGGAGIQADIKTISAIGGYAMTAITALTAQSTQGVTAIVPTSGRMIREQILTTCLDIRPKAIKTGMIADAEGMEAVVDTVAGLQLENIVVDPVMVSTSGSILSESEAVDIMKERLFPLATLITPNVSEAIVLTGEKDPLLQAKAFHESGCKAVLLKGGDSERKDVKIDILSVLGEPPAYFKADAVNTINTHGTGCTLSAAIATYLAIGYDLETAVIRAKLFVTKALDAGSFVTTGQGHGPVNHFFSPRRMKTFNPKRIYED